MVLVTLLDASLLIVGKFEYFSRLVLIWKSNSCPINFKSGNLPKVLDTFPPHRWLGCPLVPKATLVMTETDRGITDKSYS